MNRTPQKSIKVYVDTPYWFIRPKNTDWQYTRSLKGMEQFSSFSFFYSKEHRLVLEENISWLKNKLIIKEQKKLERKLRADTIKWCEPDIIYSHGKLSIIEGNNPPTVWLYGVVDPKMRETAGVQKELIEYEYSTLRKPFEACSAVLCPTQAYMLRHQEKFPYIADKFKYVPFYLNHLKATINPSILKKHFDDTKVHFLFVGRDAHRKGLDLILEAFKSLSPSQREKISLDIITSKPSKKKYFLHHKNIYWHDEAPREKVISLMNKAHVFIMPSRFETYGFVYIEAMAAGCAVISAPWESQNEIFDNGNSGHISKPNVDSIKKAIVAMCDTDYRISLAKKSLNKYNKEYINEVVSKNHYAAISSLL